MHEKTHLGREVCWEVRISNGFLCFYTCLAQIVFENELFTWCVVALASVGASLLSILVSEKIALCDVSWCVCGVVSVAVFGADILLISYDFL